MDSPELRVTQLFSYQLLPWKRPQVSLCPSTNWEHSENNFCLLEISSTTQSDAASLVAQTIKCLSQCGRPRFDPWIGKIPWRRIWQHTPLLLPGKSHGRRILVVYSPQDRRVGHDWVTSLHFPSPNTRKATVYTNILSLTSIKTSVRKTQALAFLWIFTLNLWTAGTEPFIDKILPLFPTPPCLPGKRLYL